MKRIRVALMVLVLIIMTGSLYDYFKTKKKNKIELIDTSMDTGKLLFINTILKNKNKNAKYVDSIYNIRKYLILKKI